MNPNDMPKAIILVLIGAVMIVALVPEVRTAVTGATHITGGASTVLGYLGVALVAGFTLLMVSIFLSKRTSTRFVELQKAVLRIAHAPFLVSFATNTQAITLENGIYLIVGLAIVFIFAIALLDEVAEEIANATGTGGSLENTIEGTLLAQWVLVIVASMVLGTFAIFLTRRSSKR